jgi:O-antigen/teichoic acid export membrane protein
MPKQPSMLRNMFVLILGSGAAKIIGFASLLVLTRLYDPEQFGLFNVFISCVVIVSPLLTLRFVQALPLPKQEVTSLNLLGLSVLLASISTALLYVLFTTFDSIVDLLALQNIVDMLWLVFLAAFLAAIYEILTSWNVRFKAFKRIASATAILSVVAALVKIVIPVFILGSAFGLIFGYLTGLVIGIIILYLGLKVPFSAFKNSIKVKNIKKVFVMYKGFPIFHLPSQLLILVSSQLPIFVFNGNFSQFETGQLGLAMAAIAVPVMLVARTASQAYHGEVSAIGRKRPAEIYDLTKALCVKMFFVGLLPSLTLMVGGQYIFELFFGKQWSQAGQFSSYLALMLLFQFMASPINHSFSIFKRNDLVLKLNSLRFVLVVCAFCIGYILALGSHSLIMLYSVFGSLFYLSNIVIVLVFLRKQTKIKRELGTATPENIN